MSVLDQRGYLSISTIDVRISLTQPESQQERKGHSWPEILTSSPASVRSCISATREPSRFVRRPSMRGMWPRTGSTKHSYESRTWPAGCTMQPMRPSLWQRPPSSASTIASDNRFLHRGMCHGARSSPPTGGFFILQRYTRRSIGMWRSLVARTAGGREVASSNLVIPTMYNCYYVILVLK